MNTTCTITAAVPVLTAYIVVLIRKVGENAAANTEQIWRWKGESV